MGECICVYECGGERASCTGSALGGSLRYHVDLLGGQFLWVLGGAVGGWWWWVVGGWGWVGASIFFGEIKKGLSVQECDWWPECTTWVENGLLFETVILHRVGTQTEHGKGSGPERQK